MFHDQSASDHAPPISLVALLAVPLWLAVACFLFATMQHTVAARLGDPDDALRLQQVRDLLFGGQAWYDLVQHRFNPPFGVYIHWSRLIDLPIAGMILAFKPLVGEATAELWARCLWPLVPVLPLLVAVGYIAGRLGRLPAALLAMGFAAIASCFVSILLPGRIDHHNVQLALTLVLFAGVLGSSARAAILAGLAAGVMLAIGMETLPYTVLACAVVVLRWVAEGRDPAFMRRFFQAFVLAGLASFVVTVSPALWSSPVCDMISPVYLLPLMAGAVLFSLRPFAGAGTSAPRRFLLASAVAVVALALFGTINPVCLRGPYGAVDPALFTRWMNSVGEARSALDVWRSEPGVILAVLAVPVVAILTSCACLAFGREKLRRSLPVPLLLVVMALAVALWQVRAASFATMFAIPLLALCVVEASTAVAQRGWRPAPAFAALAMILNPLTIPLAARFAGDAIAAGRDLPAARRAGVPRCDRLADYRTLAALPPGIVAAPVELGSFIIATTASSALAAPYHRDHDGILDALDIFSTPGPEARQIARRRHVDYVAFCAHARDRVSQKGPLPDTLDARLERGEVPSWLTRIASTGPLLIFKVVPGKPEPGTRASKGTGP